MSPSSLTKLLISVLLISSLQTRVQSIWFYGNKAESAQTTIATPKSADNAELVTKKTLIELVKASMAPNPPDAIEAESADKKETYLSVGAKPKTLEINQTVTAKPLKRMAARDEAVSNNMTINSSRLDVSGRKPVASGSSEKTKLKSPITETTQKSKPQVNEMVPKVNFPEFEGDQNNADSSVLPTSQPPIIQSKEKSLSESKVEAVGYAAKDIFVPKQPAVDSDVDGTTPSVPKFHPRKVNFRKSLFKAAPALMNSNVAPTESSGPNDLASDQTVGMREGVTKEPSKPQAAPKFGAACDNCGPGGFASRFEGSMKLLVLMQLLTLMAVRRLLTIS